MPRWTEPFSTVVVRPRANLMRVTMLVPCWAKVATVIIRAKIDTIAEVVKSLSKGFMVLISGYWVKRRAGSPPLQDLRSQISDLKSDNYRFGLAIVAGMPFIGI